MLKQICFYILLLAFFSGAYSQNSDGVWLHPNKGQWDSKILYKVELQNGSFYVEKDRFTYDLHNLSDIYHHHHEEGEHHESNDIKRHTIHSVFSNSSWSGELKEEKQSDFYRNYYIGNDSTKWASKVHSLKKVRMIDMYDGIDLIIEASENGIKYSFELDPNVDPSIIHIDFIGADSLNYSNESGKIYSRFGAIHESGLSSWTIDEEGSKKEVSSKFSQLGNTLQFEFPNDFNSGEKLVIDPSLTFSTFTGSTVDNWGFTAAPDNAGNLFGGGIVFGVGYPVTTGAYDGSFGGGEGSFNIDVGITKFNTSGTSLLYSTYLGASGNETPNSIVCNDQDELYILGVTSSTDFPITAGAVQSVFNGGQTTTQNALQFSGTDIFISRLNADGTALLSSTYYGGSGNDGLNTSNLLYNYGDQFRGEIIVDQNGDVFFASSTKSLDLNIVNGFDNNLGGSQDGLAVKMSNDLTNLIWSTYIGGNEADAAYALQTSSAGDVYISGGTASGNFPISGGQTSGYVGGISDGYILKLDGGNGSNIGGTFVGTPSYDQCYFVQLDQSDEVYVFGQSNGNMPISSGVYNNPNSGQFIQKFTNDLSTRLWGTVIGGGNGTIEISPTAFLVSNCYEIYYAGWGGQTNQSSQATQSTSNGLPTTPDAYQSTTNGNNFYVAVLDENALQLNYATFMGGNGSANHVDGGTSRFDKKGRIYHAVCGACGGNPNGFTTTSGVWSETNQSPNCNLAAWKFDLGIIESTISAPDPFVCIPDSVDFVNNSQNGNAYFWDFGDGNTSTEYEPSHFYSNPGIYDVTFVVSDTNGCYESDTSFLQIEIGLFEGAVVQPPNPICPGDPYQLEAMGGSTYAWSPAQYLDDSTLATPTAIIDTTTTFTVIISDSCGTDTLSLTLETYGGDAEATEDLIICRGDTVTLWATGGVDYSWSDPADIYDQVSADTAIVAPEFDTEYTVEIYTAEGCTLVETIFIEVYQDVPQPVLPDTVPVCRGDEVQVTASGGQFYSWSPNTDISATTGPTVTISTTFDRWYYVDFSNPCGSVPDSTFIDVIEVDAQAGNDTIVCPGEPVELWADGGVDYQWIPSGSVSSPFDSVTTASPQYPTVYTVIVTDQYGCTDTATVDIDHYPLPYVQASPDYYGFPGDEINLSADGNSDHGTYTWSPGEYLSCVNCQSPEATPPESITYEVTYVDENGCRATDDVSIFFEGIIYVPNSFTPDGNNYNDQFFVKGGNIEYFEMLIFNRWGEVVFETNDFDARWDGTYNGQKCKDGTYVWKIIYEDTAGNREEMVGHVNLLR
tara:strand:+ start:33696 stop:37580 length:3885 start_codon:yes stop_codon:yes gene_type:complete